MSAELKAKFTADTSDFNGAVQQIDRKLKGVGKLGQSFGLGKVGNGVGDFLQGIGGLGLIGGGIGGIGVAGMAAFRAFSASLDERTKAMEQGMPVAELTGFGRGFAAFREGLNEAGRVFSGLPKLLTEGLQSYQDFVTGDAQNAVRSFAEAQEAAARKTRELEETIAYEIKTTNAMARAKERLDNQRREDQNRQIEESNRKQAASARVETDYRRQNQIMDAEKSGNLYLAELMRQADALNAPLGMQIWSTTDVDKLMGDAIRQRLELTAPKQNEMLQSSPELSDRLRRIGGGGDAGRYGSTTQVFKESLSVERQQLQKLTTIADNIKGGALVTRQ